MKQVLIIHGGNSYSSNKHYLDDLRSLQIDYDRLKYSRSWKDWLGEQLQDYDVLTPTFPNGFNAQYGEWVIYFEKIIPFLKKDFTLVGHSLGGMFLAKYLHTHTLPIKAKKIILIAAEYARPDVDQGGFVIESATGVEQSTDEVHLFHSKDDLVVDYDNLVLFSNDLQYADIHSFDDRGHFNQPTFPELLELIKK
jgi:predicted alpha/beta hydrolase family esterase